jgi:hypothetical protein
MRRKVSAKEIQAEETFTNENCKLKEKYKTPAVCMITVKKKKAKII